MATAGAVTNIVVTVHGKAIPQGPQRFALVLTGPLNTPPVPIGGGNTGDGALIGGGGAARPGTSIVTEESGDGVAIGVALPLLLMALLGAGYFVFSRRGIRDPNPA